MSPTNKHQAHSPASPGASAAREIPVLFLLRLTVMDIFAEDVLKSWEDRDRVLAEDESSILGQHNLDSSSTRTKITHVETLGFGFIGSVLAVAYGSCGSEPAALLVMQFSFRASRISGGYRHAEISISFESQTPSSGKLSRKGPPIIQSWYPINNDLPPESNRVNPNQALTISCIAASGSTSGYPSYRSQPSALSPWPRQDFRIQGRKWSRKHKQEPHEVFWEITEVKGSLTGMLQTINLAVIVKYAGPFLAFVDTKATTKPGVKLRNFPWSRDDPLLFDGRTSKGKCPRTSNFRFMSEEEMLRYISDPYISLSDVLQAQNSSPNNSGERLQPSTTAATTDGAPGKAYRVRGIPLSWSSRFFTRVASASLALQDDSTRIHSFCQDPYGYERLAIISLESHTNVLSSNGKMEWSVPAKLPNQQACPDALCSRPRLLFDTHFYGFTELGISPTFASEPVVDIIAIPGLGGHAYGAFKERGGAHMWLENSLPSDLQTPAQEDRDTPARILIYGYDTHIENSPSFQTIGDLAGQLRMSLKAIRRDECCKRPIIFICHSLGGILIKQLLILLNEGDKVDQNHFKATRGALFFGVPNRGMENTSLVTMMDTQMNVNFLRSLSIGSPFLNEQAGQFPAVFNFFDSIIFSFYETVVTPTATNVNGKLSMSGDPMVLVDKDSATHGRPWERDSRFVMAINRNHSDLVKFGDRCEDYQRVLSCIRLLLADITQIIADRF